MDKIRRFICINTPTSACNLKCSYCYLRYCKNQKNGFPPFACDVSTFRKAISKKRMDGTCMINFTAAGETLLDAKLMDYIRAALEEGHFVEVVTNATLTKEFERIAAFPKELLERLMMKCSFHYEQLKKLGWLDRFFSNVRMVRDAGASITVELMPHDEILGEREAIRDLCIREVGAPCHLTVARYAGSPLLPRLSRLSVEEYAKAWGMFDSRLFEYKLSVFEKPQHKFCYAGEWMMVLSLGTGEVSQCYTGNGIFNLFKDVDKPLPFKAIGCGCLEAHCFNAHAWLTFGCIPGEDAPYYDEVRNRVCADGSEWLKPRVKAFFHQKFGENNAEYGAVRKMRINAEMKLRRLMHGNRVVRGVALFAKRLACGELGKMFGRGSK